MSKSFSRMFLECMVVSMLGASLLIPVALFVGKRPNGDALIAWLSVGLLVGVTATIIRYLLSTARQKREVLLPCNFEDACAHCLASLELFPNHREHESEPGAYTFVVNNNPTFRALPAAMTPEKFGWIEWVTLTVEPMGSSETLVKIETLADLNRAAQVILDRQRHNADLISEYLEQQCAIPD